MSIHSTRNTRGTHGYKEEDKHVKKKIAQWCVNILARASFFPSDKADPLLQGPYVSHINFIRPFGTPRSRGLFPYMGTSLPALNINDRLYIQSLFLAFCALRTHSRGHREPFSMHGPNMYVWTAAKKKSRLGLKVARTQG